MLSCWLLCTRLNTRHISRQHHIHLTKAFSCTWKICHGSLWRCFRSSLFLVRNIFSKELAPKHSSAWFNVPQHTHGAPYLLIIHRPKHLFTSKMSDPGFDPCECMWNHELAMRRLISLVRYSAKTSSLLCLIIDLLNSF